MICKWRRKGKSCMKGIRDVIGFVSIGLFLFILLKACAAGWGGGFWIGNAEENASEIFFAMLMLVAGTIAIAGRTKSASLFAGMFYVLGAAAGAFGAERSGLLWCGAAATFFAIYFFIAALCGHRMRRREKSSSDKKEF